MTGPAAAVAPGRLDRTPTGGRLRVRSARRASAPPHRDRLARQRQGLLERVGVETGGRHPGRTGDRGGRPNPHSGAAARRGRHRTDPHLAARPRHRGRHRRGGRQGHGYDQTPSVTPDTEMPPLPAIAPRGARRRPGDAGRRRPDGGRRCPRLARAPRALPAPRAGHPSTTTRSRSGRRSSSATLSRDHSVLRQGCIGSLPPSRRDEPAARPLRRGHLRDRQGLRPLWRRDAHGGLGLALTGAAEPPSWNRPLRAYVSTTPRAWSSCCLPPSRARRAAICG